MRSSFLRMYDFSTQILKRLKGYGFTSFSTMIEHVVSFEFDVNQPLIAGSFTEEI